MKLFGCFGIILAWACLQSVVAQEDPDTMWLCRDTTSEYGYVKMFLADTFPDNRGQFNMVDTGASYNGSPYVNFNYQFTNDSVFIPGRYLINDTIHDTAYYRDTIYRCAPRPGYAGFKFYWDNGRASFWVSDFDSMILWHKGPLPGHKVKMIWAQGSAGCGTPINYECMGEFKSSTTWKRESIPFPVKRNYGAAPDSDFVKKGLFELRMLIYNDSTITTDSLSQPGDLKIDNMYFLKRHTGVRNPKLAPGAVGGPRFFVPKVSGKVTLAVFSLQGEQLFQGPVDVAAGRKYDVGQFARKYSNLPAAWIQCVKITGPGVNVTRKVVR